MGFVAKKTSNIPNPLLPSLFNNIHHLLQRVPFASIAKRELPVTSTNRHTWLYHIPVTCTSFFIFSSLRDNTLFCPLLLPSVTPLTSQVAYSCRCFFFLFCFFFSDTYFDSTCS